MINFVARMDAWLEMPLCRQYVSAHFGLQPIQVVAAGASHLAVNWALGCLSDGDCEVLGAWPASGAEPTSWRNLSDEFVARGVECISYVLADGCSGVRHSFPFAIVFPPFMQILSGGQVTIASGAGLLGAEARRAVREAASGLWARVALERVLARSVAGGAAVLAADWLDVLTQLEPFYSLRAERRTLIRRGDEVLEQLGLMLNRAVRRHGPFADVGSAVSFVGRTLARAEAQLSSSALPAVRLPARRAGVSIARAAGLAPIG